MDQFRERGPSGAGDGPAGRGLRAARPLVGVAVALGAFFLASALLAPPEEVPSDPRVAPEGGAPAPASDTGPQREVSGRRKAYALPLSELAGLPPDIPPGTVMELWVAWDPPLTEEPRIHRLIRGVVLEEVIPPLDATSVGVALISVRARDIDLLLWGDRYGSLSVTLAG